MRAGAGNAEIAFSQELFPLEGFCGIHDLPKVGVILMEGINKIALVSVEIVMLPDDLLQTCREMVANLTDTPVQNVWIHVTHAITTPHAPGGPMLGLGGEMRESAGEETSNLLRKRELYEHALLSALNRALKAAIDMREARLYVGARDCNLIEGRDIETPFGWWIGTKGSGVSNETMTVLVLRDLENHIIAALISYGMKPCVIDNSEMEQGTRLISADAPGMCCRELERIYHAPILYGTAAAGDRVPVRTAWYDRVGADGRIETVDLGVAQGFAFANEIAAEMTKVAREIIDCAREMIVPHVICRRTAYAWGRKTRVTMQPRREIAYIQEGEVQVPVDVILLGDVALVAGRPEINSITERQLQEQSQYSHTLYLSMVNGGMKYMPDQDAYDRVTWEAQSSMLMPGAAERFVDTAIKLLEEE